MMTPEQFVFWLSGFLSAYDGQDPDATIEVIFQTIKRVFNPHSNAVAFHFSEKPND